MIYTYAYKSSDGIRHEETLDARSRDEVFATLRARGIKAVKVTAADGSKANGEVIVRGVRRRCVVAGAIGLTVVAIIAAIYSFQLGANSLASRALPRQIVDFPTNDKLSAAFPNIGHRQLVEYAVPGRDVQHIQSIDIEDACRAIVFSSHDAENITRLKRVLIGLQQEAQRFRSVPNGGRAFASFLNERQEMEKMRFSDLTRRISRKEISIYEANRILRAMGLQSAE